MAENYVNGFHGMREFHGTFGDLMDGSRNYAERGISDVPGTLHFWMRIADAEV